MRAAARCPSPAPAAWTPAGAAAPRRGRRVAWSACSRSRSRGGGRAARARRARQRRQPARRHSGRRLRGAAPLPATQLVGAARTARSPTAPSRLTVDLVGAGVRRARRRRRCTRASPALGACRRRRRVHAGLDARALLQLHADRVGAHELHRAHAARRSAHDRPARRMPADRRPAAGARAPGLSRRADCTRSTSCTSRPGARRAAKRPSTPSTPRAACSRPTPPTRRR